MKILRADTAINLPIGPIVAVGDGYTRVNNLTLSGADVAELIKHNATAVTDISSNTITGYTGADGFYYIALTAAQLDTEGQLTLFIADDSLILPYRQDMMVVNANVYDSLYAAAATDYLLVDVEQMNSATLLGNGTSGNKWRG